MQNEDTELEKEPHEQLVQRARWHLGEVATKKGTEPEAAATHNELATELIDRLWEQVLSKAEAIARRVLGTTYDMHLDGVVEIYKELDRAIRSLETREGLETHFEATFQRIALDGCRRARSSNQRLSGKGWRKEEIVSGDEESDQPESEIQGSILERVSDPKAVQNFFDFLDAGAIRSVMERLPCRQRQVLTLRVNGYDFQEIGEMLAPPIHRETASSDFDKACRFIRNHLAQ